MELIETNKKTISTFNALLSASSTTTHPLLVLNDQFKTELLQTRQINKEKESLVPKMELSLVGTASLLFPKELLKRTETKKY